MALEGAWNFRDLGGYAAAGGRRVLWRRLFRADGLDRLTPTDRETLTHLGVRTVVDLRTTDEVARGAVDGLRGAFRWHHLPMLDVLPPREDFEDWVVSRYVAEEYLSMLDEAPASVAAFLRLLTDDHDIYPVVFHCFAGKDRTGVLSAVVLGLLGVSDEDIAGDYALSRLAMTSLLEWLRAAYGEEGREEIEARAPAIASAEPATMTIFLERFRALHGSFDDFAGEIGVPEAPSRLRELLLEP